MHPLDLVKLRALMELASGSPEVVVGLIDGPVALDHPALANSHISEIPETGSGACDRGDTLACLHGTFVAGILFAKRGSDAPGICPDCTVLIHPIFAGSAETHGGLPIAAPGELARAILACINSGARILNISAAIEGPSSKSERLLEEALAYAARRGVVVVVAAGNQGTLSSTVITRHPWVIPVISYDLQGRAMTQSNLGSSIGRRGLGGPGDRVTSLGVDGNPVTLGGTSAAVPFVTGAIALLWSLFPTAGAAEIRSCVTNASAQRRNTVVPPLLDAWAAYQVMAKTRFRPNGA